MFRFGEWLLCSYIESVVTTFDFFDWARNLEQLQVLYIFLPLLHHLRYLSLFSRFIQRIGDQAAKNIPTFDSTMFQGFVRSGADQKPLANEDKPLFL